MNQLERKVLRLGAWSAFSTAIVGALYVFVGALGVIFRPQGSALLDQVDPYLAVLEILIILSALMLVTMMCAVHCYAKSEQKTITLAALSFTIIFAALTSSLHFISLTVARQVNPKVDGTRVSQLSFEGWPTVAASLDFLAWDLFLGLSFLLASRFFSGRTKAFMTACGLFCLLGFLGPVSGHLRIQFLAIAGYGFILPVACVLVGLHFRREMSRDS